MAALSRQDELDLRMIESEEPGRRIDSLFHDPFSKDDVDGEGTHYDRADMKRMDKQQQLRRKFEITSVVGFSSCVMGWVKLSSLRISGGHVDCDLW